MSNDSRVTFMVTLPDGIKNEFTNVHYDGILKFSWHGSFTLLKQATEYLHVK